MCKIFFRLFLPTILLLLADSNDGVFGTTEDNNIPVISDSTYIYSLFDSVITNLESYETALKYANNALTFSKSIDYKRGIALSYFYRGIVLVNNDKQNDAIKNLKTSLKLFKEIKLYNNIAINYRYLGNSYYFLSKFDTALIYSKKGLLLSDSINNKLESARIKSQIGACYEDLGQYEKSLSILLEAHDDFILLNNLEGIAETLNSLGVIYNTLNEFEKADNYFREALKIYRKSGDVYGESNCLTNIAQFFFLNHQPDSALNYYYHSLHIDSLRADNYGICLSLANIGEVYILKQDYSKARGNLLSALEIALKIKNTTLIAGIYSQLAKLELELKNYSKAISYGKKSLIFARQTESPESIINTFNILNDVYSRNGNYKEAYKCLHAIVKLKDSVFSIEKNKQIIEIQAKYEDQKRELEIQALKSKNKQQARIKRILWITIILGMLLIMGLFFFILYIRKSRNRIKIQKKYFETLIANSEDYVIVVDDKAYIKYLSPSYEKRTGRKAENRIGESALEFIHPDDISLLNKTFKKALTTKNPLSFEFRAIDASGEWLNLSAIAKNLLNDPDVNGIVINVWDITDRKYYEKLILEKQREIEQSQKLAKLGSWKININSKTITLSKEVMTLLGEKENELTFFFDDFISDYFVEEDIIFVKEKLAHAIENINKNVFYTEKFEARAKRKNSEDIIYVKLWAEYAEQDIIHGVTQDITEKKEAEKQIFESEKSYRELFDNALDAIYILDKDGKFIDVNKGANKMYGYKTEEFVGRTPEFLSAPGKNDMKMVQQCLTDAYNGNARQIEFWGLRKDKTVFPKLVRMSPGNYFGKKVVIVFGTDITQIRNAEIARMESEEKYKNIYSAFQDVYFKVSVDGTVVEVSPSVKSVFAYSQEELLGSNSGMFYEMNADLEKFQSELFIKKEIKDFNVSLKSKNGKTIYCSLSAKLIFDEKNVPVCIEGILRDITDRRKTEIKLVESEKKFREIFYAFPDVYYKVNNDNIVVEISPSVTKIAGYLPNEIIGMPVSVFYINKEEREIFLSTINRKDEVSDFNISLRAKNGRIINCSINATIIYDNKKKRSGIAGVIRDISDRRKIELALKQSEKKYRDVFNAFIDVYYRISMDGTILEITPSVEHIGYTREELIGTSVNNLYPKDVDQKFLYKELAIKKQVTDYDIVMLTKDNRKLDCAVTARVINDENGKPLMIEGVVRDISERVKTQKDLEKSERQLKRSNETKEKILSIIGHDLLGPIGTNKGMTDLVVNEKDKLTKDEIVELIISLKPAMDSTYTMVENILSWAKLHKDSISYKPEPAYLKPIIDENFALFSVHAKSKSIELVFNGLENLSAYFDKNQILIVIRNLISNAIKFTEKGGQVIVNMDEKNGFAEVSVTDTGIGIPEKHLSVLFQDSVKKESRFGTDNEKGTGLGLVIVNEFVKLNKGTIKVKSEEGEGTTFTFTLPLIL